MGLIKYMFPDIPLTWNLVICPLLLAILVPTAYDMVIQYTKSLMTHNVKRLIIATVETIIAIGIIVSCVLITSFMDNYHEILKFYVVIIDLLGLGVGIILIIYRNHK